MAKLEQVIYEKENGKLVATEMYDDGTERKVKIKNGITEYVLLGDKE